MANVSLADVIVHVDETLDKDARARLESNLHSMDGVISVCSREEAPHLVIVTFDPDHAKSKDILKTVLGEHLHAELIGL